MICALDSWHAVRFSCWQDQCGRWGRARPRPRPAIAPEPEAERASSRNGQAQTGEGAARG